MMASTLLDPELRNWFAPTGEDNVDQTRKIQEATFLERTRSSTLQRIIHTIKLLYLGLSVGEHLAATLSSYSSKYDHITDGRLLAEEIASDCNLS